MAGVREQVKYLFVAVPHLQHDCCPRSVTLDLLCQPLNFISWELFCKYCSASGRNGLLP